MTMKRAAVLTAALAAFAAPAAAQVASFSGTWEIERQIAPTNRPGEGAAPGTVATIARGGSLGIGLSGGFGQVGQFIKSRPPDRLVIVQTATELRIQERWIASVESGAYERTYVYPLDGSEAKQPVPGGQLVTKSVWQDGRLVTTGVRQMDAGGRGRGRGGDIPPEIAARGFGGGDQVEARFLSDDGAQLTIESTTRSRGGESTTTLIFKRVSGS